MRAPALLFCALLLSAVVAGQSAPPPAPAPPSGTEPVVTFNTDIAPIFFEHCTRCHRPGQGAPMSLLTYDTARPWARSIKQQVTQRKMPPWFADPAIGHFANDPRLDPRAIDLIVRWVDTGAVRGEGPEPPAPTYADGWEIGTPDLVLPIAEPFSVPAEGVGDYQYFRIPTNLTEDRWVQAIEIRPGDRRVVHHALAFVKSEKPAGLALRPGPDGAWCSDDACGEIEVHDAGMGPIFAGMAVGTPPEIYPPGAAKLLPAGSVFTLQVHYTPFGAAVQDRTAVGIVFAKKEPTTKLRTVLVSKHEFTIPPHAAAHQLDAQVTFRRDVDIWSIAPHAHLRGKSWQFELIGADGVEQSVLAVPRFDFNWQLLYKFASPLRVSAGTRFRTRGVFDNSAANKANPDPNATVRWGNMTNDEMLIASLIYSVRDAAK
jgi:mono/diheme cytochrome c family protein